MADLVLFPAVLGVTEGIRAFAQELRDRGHSVSLQDLFEGRVFPSLETGMAYAEEVGFDEIVRRGVEAVSERSPGFAVGGFSLGVLPAHRVLQTVPGVRGGVLLHAFVDPDGLGGTWPDGVPVQVHGMDGDPFFAGEGDLDAARRAQEEHPGIELFLYPGSGHLFTDATSADYEPIATRAALDRIGAFLDALDRAAE